ncbi:MAG: sodium/glutamate symporter [Planctomycetota bacterium]
MMETLVVTAVLFAVGLLLCDHLKWLQKIYLPAPVVAGLLGLIAVRSSLQFDVAASWTLQRMDVWGEWPGTLIAIVFAAMLLQKPVRSSGAAMLQGVGQEGLMVWIIALGQTAVGFLVTWLILKPFLGTADVFGVFIETGFAGGHGTAAGMGELLDDESFGVENPLAIGTTVATFGLVYGVLSGIVLVNIGTRMGWHAAGTELPPLESEPILAPEYSGASIERESNPNTRPASVGDPWLWQCVWLGLAFGIGLLGQAAVHGAVSSLEGPVPDGEKGWADLISSFPIFIYTLLGGWIVRQALSAAKLSHLLDSSIVSRISSMAMDVLVVAAISSLRLDAIVDQILPLSILLFAGSIWSAVCLVVLARRILPRQHWFELGLINYGMSTGVTATGFVLLRLVDPKFRTRAAQDYALAAPLSSPFVGGGIVTYAVPGIFLASSSLGVVTLTLVASVVVLIALAIFWRSNSVDSK